MNLIPSSNILPPGWTEHLGPGNQPYYYNTQTRESTYVRPIPVQTTTKKKEKPLVKTPIPGTEWLRVITTEGNTFYSHKLKRESVWVIPEEIRSAVEGLQAEERRQRDAGNSKLGEPTQDTISVTSKRKAETSLVGDEAFVNKRAKVDDDDDDDGDNDEETSEDEDWQQQAAEQLAAEAEEERKRLEAEMEKEKELEVQRTRAAAEIIMPQKVDLSIEEGKALFKTLLREKDINPLHPWDISLPKFVSDPRYVLLPSVAARREAFDEYCKERARELRQSSVKKDKEAANPKDEYDRLLKDEVKSTRASWTDFRRVWKKDRRFYGWGRDDREREKRFREFLKDLGEQKRAAAQKAEANFFALLKEHLFTEGLSWKEAKKILHQDTRYEAVGSSSLREELYNTFMKGRVSQSAVDQSIVDNSKQLMVENVKDGASERQERRDRAVKEREDKINDERKRLEVAIERSKLGINMEEGERSFMTLLTDAIRDPQVSWEGVLPQLKTDPRFTNSPLPLNHQLQLFHVHTSHLRSKYISSLHALFHSHATLATPFSTLPLETILSSSPVIKLGFHIEQVEDEYDKWQRERTDSSRTAFDEMLAENSFVEFWGRLGKIGGEGVNSSVKIDGDDIGEGDGEEKVDMKALAKNIDIQEMEKVLKGDSRYSAFDHVPEQRERWLRNYLSKLSAPNLSVHVDG